MKEIVEIIKHRGKTVYYSDYTGMKDEAALDTIRSHYNQHRKFIDAGATDMLFLTNVENAVADRAIMKLFKETTQKNASHTKRSAVIGVEGIQKVLLNGVIRASGMNTKAFSSREEALDWLAE
jgi:uncharacterized protein related to proFAR isomerase